MGSSQGIVAAQDAWSSGLAITPRGGSCVRLCTWRLLDLSFRSAEPTGWRAYRAGTGPTQPTGFGLAMDVPARYMFTIYPGRQFMFAIDAMMLLVKRRAGIST